MEVTDEMLDRVARLSRLSFGGREKQELKKDLQKMISFVDKLGELDTTGIEPLTHMGFSGNAWREDEAGGMADRQAALVNAPHKNEQYFKVPKVINPR
jgi:aspartyl-tRNA(Asn)/glutamyl-tRNA(Gln) amidotransferase subunit C